MIWFKRWIEKHVDDRIDMRLDTVKVMYFAKDKSLFSVGQASGCFPIVDRVVLPDLNCGHVNPGDIPREAALRLFQLRGQSEGVFFYFEVEPAPQPRSG